MSQFDGYPAASLPLGPLDLLLIAQWNAGLGKFETKKIPEGSLLASLNAAGIQDIQIISATINPGLVSLAGKTVTSAVAALKTTDIILPLGVTGGLTLGSIITGARCSVNGTLEVRLATSIAIGITLGSQTYTFLRLVMA